MESYYLIIHLILGPLMLVLSLVYKSFPPKSINMLYGYRTRSSMKSPEVWDASNAYASNLMMWMSIATIAFQAAFHFLIESQANVILASTIALTVLLIATIPLTEKFIKDNFDKEGKPL